MSKAAEAFAAPCKAKLERLVVGNDSHRDIYVPFETNSGAQRKDSERFRYFNNPLVCSRDGAIAGVSSALDQKIRGLLKLVGSTESGEALLAEEGISTNGEVVFEKDGFLALDSVRGHFEDEEKKVLADAGEFGEGVYDETFAMVEDVRLHLLKTCEISSLFSQCEDFGQCKALFDDLSTIPGFKEELLNVRIFEIWLDKTLSAGGDDGEAHVIYVLDLMKECGYSATVKMALLLLVEVEMDEVVKKSEEWGLASATNSLPVLNKIMTGLEDHVDIKELFYKMVASGVTPDEETYTLWMGKVSFTQALEAAVCVRECLKKCPDELLKAMLLRFLRGENQAELALVTSFITKNGYISEDWFEGEKLDPKFAEEALGIFLRSWKEATGNDFIKLFWDAAVGTEDQFLRFCAYTSGLANYYKFLRKRSLLVHGEHAFNRCKTSEEYYEVIDHIWANDVPFSEATVNSIQMTGNIPVTQQLIDAMERFFSSKGIENLEELYNLHRLGQTPDYYFKIIGGKEVPINMRPWLELYGKMRSVTVTDQLEDVMDLVDLAWPQEEEDPIFPPAGLLYKFDFKKTEWIGLKKRIEEYFSGDERPDIKLRKKSGLDEKWLVFYAFINRKVREITIKAGKGQKKRSKRPRKKK